MSVNIISTNVINTPVFYLEIVLPVPLRQSFTYLPAINSQIGDYNIGARVKVPFGQKLFLIGFIYKIVLKCSNKFKLKRITELVDSQAILSQDILNLINFAATYYHHPIGEAYFAALPLSLKQGQHLDKFSNKIVKLNTDGDFLKAKKKLTLAQSKLINILTEHQISTQKGLSFFALDKLGIKKSTIDSLADKNWLYIKQGSEVDHKNKIISAENLLKEKLLILNQEQQLALNQILTNTNNLAKFSCYLLYGVTGSGKTEVYMHLIYEVLLQKKQVLVLVPEISLTPQTVERFKKRFHTKISVIHSKISGNNKTKDWLAADSGQAGIILGTRSAIFTPIKKLGLIIIDEEHDQSFKQQEGFKYNARDLSIIRAARAQIPVILGSATPSIESVANVINKKFEFLTLKSRAGTANLPKIRLLNIKQKHLTSGLSSDLINSIKNKLEAKQQVLIFLNRRGFSPVTKCIICNWGAMCKRCDVYYTLHKQEALLICHYCNSSKKIYTHCPECGNNNLNSYGVGTEQIEEYVTEIFKDYVCLRIDRDTTKNKYDMEHHIEKIKTNSAQILLGTQMLAKGHHFPNVTLVAILDCDSGLFSADFRAPERLVQLLMQVAGRAGRGILASEVLIQTTQPEHQLFQDILKKDYWTIAQELYQIRKQANLPPCNSWGLLHAQSHKLNKTMEFLADLKAAVLSQVKLEDIKMIGPIISPKAKKAGLFRGQIIFAGANRKILQEVVSQVIEIMNSLKSSSIRWSIDIDPYDII